MQYDHSFYSKLLEKPDYKISEILSKLAENIDPNYVIDSSTGKTFLMSACELGKYKTVQQLIVIGANTNAKDKKGKYVFEYIPKSYCVLSKSLLKVVLKHCNNISPLTDYRETVKEDKIKEDTSIFEEFINCIKNDNSEKFILDKYTYNYAWTRNTIDQLKEIISYKLKSYNQLRYSLLSLSTTSKKFVLQNRNFIPLILKYMLDQDNEYSKVDFNEDELLALIYILHNKEKNIDKGEFEIILWLKKDNYKTCNGNDTKLWQTKIEEYSKKAKEFYNTDSHKSL